MTSLNELIGETIVICPVIPFRSDHRKDMIYRIKLVGVESGGSAPRRATRRGRDASVEERERHQRGQVDPSGAHRARFPVART